MNIQHVNVSKEAAHAALLEYKQHRDRYDKRDWEIERIYRQIAKGNIVISAGDAIRAAGLDSKGRPKLAICEAHATHCVCSLGHADITFGIFKNAWSEGVGRFKVAWPNLDHGWIKGAVVPGRLVAQLPRIPPQHRPAGDTLARYHLLWEADWTDMPRDPYLLKRIGKDAFVVLAAWDLTDVEMMVLRAHQPAQ
jgi:hypothetical protein